MTVLECPRMFYEVKNTNVKKFGEKGLVICGDLCSVIYGRRTILIWNEMICWVRVTKLVAWGPWEQID